jgi:hypothetical protein
MSHPSYYFTLFKKFQCLGHVPEKAAHGSALPPQGVSFKDPVTLYGAARGGVPLIGVGTADTPLWGVLNAKANGQSSFVFGGLNWAPMPLGTGSDAAWNDPAVGGQGLVDAFAAWLAAGKPQDFPASIALPNAGTVSGPLDAGGPSIFVCSAANDNGTRPGTIPSNFWSSSLIYLVDRTNGVLANPPTLHGAQEYYVAAVVGNRGDAVGGKFGTGPGAVITPGVQAVAWALTFGTGGASPAVQLPSLSNLDVNAQDGINDLYFLPSGGYDIVGWRLTVQTVFDGLVAAINDAVANGAFTLPVGVTADQWLKTPPSHVCLKVAARREDQSWPAYDASPLVERRIAQKNLVVFDVDLAAPSPMPNIKWKYFTVGGPIQAMMNFMRASDRELGLNTLALRTDFAREEGRMLLALPRAIFARWLGKDGVKGCEIVERDCRERFKVPFDDHVVLEQAADEMELRIPPLDGQALPMAIGVQIDQTRLKPDTVHRVTLVHRAVVPHFGKGKEARCYQPETAIVGGFTLEFRIRRSESGTTGRL